MSKLFYTCGLPGSGKSTWAEKHKDELNAVIHSTDSVREELGDVNDQSKNELVFTTLHKRIKEDLLNGKNVIYDATNLKRKNRLHFLRQIKNIPCEKVCVLFATPVEVCLKNNANRERKVPEEVINHMVKSFNTPCKQEKWDDIQIVWWDWEKDEIEFNIFTDIMEKFVNVSHNNFHHSLSIGEHMIEAAYQCQKKYPNEFPVVYFACLLHDCGKPDVKDFHDSKGNPSEIAHFYQHENYSALKSLFYLKDSFNWMDDEILHISLLINLHMRPYVWDKSEKAKERDKNLFGEDILRELSIINECDRAAH